MPDQPSPAATTVPPRAAPTATAGPVGTVSDTVSPVSDTVGTVSDTVGIVSDMIEIRGLELLALCGVLPEERDRAQPFRFDLDVAVDLRAAGVSDSLEDTVDYGALIQQIAALVRGTQFNLLEAMAHHVAVLALREFPMIASITVAAHKLRPPVPEHVAHTGVRISRDRTVLRDDDGSSDGVVVRGG